MALEEVISRLVAVLERNQEAPAVAEIIRQRDDWKKLYEGTKQAKEYYEGRTRELYDEGMKKDRRSQALRGVITRMKRKGEKPNGV